jgi:hypothetical protein
MTTQLEFPASKTPLSWLPVFSDLNPKTVEEWITDHRKNPVNYAKFEEITLKRIQNGAAHLRSKRIIEDLRDDIEIQKTGQFKIDNSYSGCLSRWFEFCHPEYAGIFEKRHTPGTVERAA